MLGEKQRKKFESSVGRMEPISSVKLKFPLCNIISSLCVLGCRTVITKQLTTGWDILYSIFRHNLKLVGQG